MLPILQNNSPLTMTLKEITDLLEVRHDLAMKKVKKLSKELTFGTMFEIDIAYNESGQTIKTYCLDERQSLAVASILNTALLMRVIDRIKELESNSEKFVVPKTLPDALRLAADLADQLAIAAPKIAVYELLADRMSAHGRDESKPSPSWPP